MASDTLKFPTPDEPSTPVNTHVHSFSVQFTVSCGCGSPIPMMVHFIPGLELKTTCQVCKRLIKVARIQYDGDKGPNVTVGVYEAFPNIITPPPGLVI